jgi:hypothetical protein
LTTLEQQHQLHNQLAVLIAWMQRQQLATALPTDINPHARLWGTAMQCLYSLMQTVRCCSASDAALHAEQVTVALDKQGAAAVHQQQKRQQQQCCSVRLACMLPCSTVRVYVYT